MSVIAVQHMADAGELELRQPDRGKRLRAIGRGRVWAICGFAPQRWHEPIVAPSDLGSCAMCRRLLVQAGYDVVRGAIAKERAS